MVTGGAGFIGSTLVRQFLADSDLTVVNVDKLTYAASPATLSDVENHSRYSHEKLDICDRAAIERVLAEARPRAVMHLAAETHVDRSIERPDDFVQTNIVGTYTMLEAAMNYWLGLDGEAKTAFRLVHVSTDEVFGSLGDEGAFTETTPYQPRSPYSASKAGSDHLVQAWHATYGLPTVLTSCSNNFGPYQFPEKLIPLITIKALRGESLPVYGKGANIRDWLYVEDHASALRLALEKGAIGECYNIGARSERTNLDVVRGICRLLDEFVPDGAPHERLITFVEDRPGHDYRYAMDPRKIESELAWRPRESFESGLRKTVQWYLQNRSWWQAILDETYCGERLGRGKAPALGSSA